MNRAALLIALLALAAPTALGAQGPTELDELVRRGDTYLDPRTGEPFSGPVVLRYDADRVRERGTLEDGRWEGIRESYHLNGQVSLRETFRDGRLNGPSEGYFKSGQLSVKEMYVADELDGPYESYWSRGWVAEQGMWANGAQCGEWTSFGRTLTFPRCPGTER